MNKYKITYVVGEGQTEESYITERTEKAARKAIKEQSGGREVVDVELYETDAIATKQQERDTLAKIREMVAELGPQSYLKTAFKGAFEDAEQNIEDDAAYCQYDRAELAEQRVKELEAELEKANKGLNAALDSAASYAEQIEACEAKLKKQTLPPRLFKMLWMLVADTEEIATNHMAQEAQQQGRATSSAPSWTRRGRRPRRSSRTSSSSSSASWAGSSTTSRPRSSGCAMRATS